MTSEKDLLTKEGEGEKEKEKEKEKEVKTSQPVEASKEPVTIGLVKTNFIQQYKNLGTISLV